MVPTDVTDGAAVDGLVAAAVDRFGRLDAVVHSVTVVAYGRFDEVPAEVFDQVIAATLTGAANVSRSALRRFRVQDGGRLVLVGSLMVGSVAKIDWSDAGESLPAFLTIVGIPLTYSIADGLALGLISYPIVKVASGRARDVRWPMIALAALLIPYYVFIRGQAG